MKFYVYRLQVCPSYDHITRPRLVAIEASCEDAADEAFYTHEGPQYIGSCEYCGSSGYYCAGEYSRREVIETVRGETSYVVYLANGTVIRPR